MAVAGVCALRLPLPMVNDNGTYRCSMLIEWVTAPSLISATLAMLAASGV